MGYYNASSFRRKFKQETGLSPSQFRTDFQEPESPQS
ncbi:MAG: AraC family transcriptional regulator [Lachnospiraceae bacterium]|nr:AraC family transcriptional regulator [Lachnospiraceae bacterium]